MTLPEPPERSPHEMDLGELLRLIGEQRQRLPWTRHAQPEQKDGSGDAGDRQD